MWFHSPERVSGLRPARFPADETSVQGKPPVTMSTGPCSSMTDGQSMAVTSPRLGTVGQCRARIFAAYWFLSSLPFLSGGSYCECHTTSAS